MLSAPAKDVNALIEQLEISRDVLAEPAILAS